MPVLLAPADVTGYLGNNMGPNNILLFENILQEDTFIWLCLVYLKNGSGYPEQYTGKKPIGGKQRQPHVGGKTAELG
jgi:hypothetical protein